MADGTVLLTPKMSRCASPAKLAVQSRNADGVSPDRPELPEGGVTELEEGGGATVFLLRSSTLSRDPIRAEGLGGLHCPQPYLEDSSVYRQNRSHYTRQEPWS